MTDICTCECKCKTKYCSDCGGRTFYEKENK